MSETANDWVEVQAAPRKSQQGASLADEADQRVIEAQRALTDRPSISISLRIHLSMLLCFLLVSAVVAASMVLITRVGKSQEFMEKASTYTLEVEHARRLEKNYLLYGTDLSAAVIQIDNTHRHLRGMKDRMIEVSGRASFEQAEANLERYGDLLSRLSTLGTRPGEEASPERVRIEREVRMHGAQIVADATDLLDKERLRLRTAIRNSLQMGGASLLVILIVMAVISYALSVQVVSPLRRFNEYTKRIAHGDFSLIQPARRYRDEFSHLAIAINRMIAQLQDREVQLARASRVAAIGTLTAGIAHELNNPLNNIGINAEALDGSLESYSDEQKHKMLGDIMSQVARASGTVRNLLDFTRDDRPAMAPTRIAQVVERASTLVGNEAGLNNVTFQLEIPEGLPKILASPRDLEQVFLNLFLNAIQAMPQGGLLRVAASRTKDHCIQVAVTDNGSGIAPESIESIFDPFFTTKEVGAGTGLGLFVSYGIIEKHRGSIAVRSKLGEGTTFTITLPAIPNAEH